MFADENLGRKKMVLIQSLGHALMLTDSSASLENIAQHPHPFVSMEIPISGGNWGNLLNGGEEHPTEHVWIVALGHLRTVAIRVFIHNFAINHMMCSGKHLMENNTHAWMYTCAYAQTHV